MSHRTVVRAKFKSATVSRCLRNLGWLGEEDSKKLSEKKVGLSVPGTRYGVYAYTSGTELAFQYDSDDRMVPARLSELNAECARLEVRDWAQEMGLYVTETQENGKLVFCCEEC